MANSKTPKQIVKDMELLQSKGYNVPLPALAFARQKEMKERGVKQYYMCSKDGHKYESYVKVDSVECPKGHAMKKIWDL